MAKKSDSANTKRIIWFAIVFSILLYMAGVFSGLYANKIIEKKTQQDLQSMKAETENNIAGFRAETQQNVEYMQRYVAFLETSLKSIQLDQMFVESLDSTSRCNFSKITMKSLLGELGFYWEKLPFRIEAYEQNNKLSAQYLELKKQYIQLSIRAWIIARSKSIKCNTGIVPVLYFYAANCSECIAQGEELDKLQANATRSGDKVIVFTVDEDSDDMMIRNIEEFYNISSAPALIIGKTVLQARVFDNEEIRKIVDNQ